MEYERQLVSHPQVSAEVSMPPSRLEELREVSQQTGPIALILPDKMTWVIEPSGVIDPLGSTKVIGKSEERGDRSWQITALNSVVPDKDAVGDALDELPGLLKVLGVDGKTAKGIASSIGERFYNAGMVEQVKVGQHILSQHGVIFEGVNNLNRQARSLENRGIPTAVAPTVIGPVVK